MNKYQALNLIKEKVPKEKLFDEFKREQNMTLENIQKNKYLSRVINNLICLKPETKAYIVTINMLISFTVLIIFSLNNISIYTFIFTMIMIFFYKLYNLRCP